MEEKLAVPDVLSVDHAAVVYTDEAGKRWRLPKGAPEFDVPGPLGLARLAREVSTERDLMNAHRTFYELPAENAGGIAMVRPVATHNRRIHDYCSYRGLVVLSGLRRPARPSEHVVVSEDGQVALWLGVSDDLWQLGKPRGRGGPWRNSEVKAGIPSDPYLLTGYDRKRISLEHDHPSAVAIRIEVDLTGTGVWRPYREFDVPAGRPLDHEFEEGYSAYWLRAIADRDCAATVTLSYS
ncbi:MAG: hypothetical protein ACK5AZ_12515 [Bryobacteraceae bacterium]